MLLICFPSSWEQNEQHMSECNPQSHRQPEPWAMFSFSPPGSAFFKKKKRNEWYTCQESWIENSDWYMKLEDSKNLLSVCLAKWLHDLTDLFTSGIIQDASGPRVPRLCLLQMKSRNLVMHKLLECSAEQLRTKFEPASQELHSLTSQWACPRSKTNLSIWTTLFDCLLFGKELWMVL